MNLCNVLHIWPSRYTKKHFYAHCTHLDTLLTCVQFNVAYNKRACGLVVWFSLWAVAEAAHKYARGPGFNSQYAPFFGLKTNQQGSSRASRTYFSLWCWFFPSMLIVMAPHAIFTVRRGWGGAVTNTFSTRLLHTNKVPTHKNKHRNN